MKQNLRYLMLALLCAVFSTAWGEEKTATLTNANIVAAGTATQGYNSWTITDSNSKTWNAYAIKNQHSNATSSYHYLQIKKYAPNTAYYIQIPEYGTKITSITMTVSNASNPIDGGGNNATLYFSASNSTSATGTGVASGNGESSVTIDCSSLNLNTGYITASGAVRIWDVAITYEEGSSSSAVATPTFNPAAGEVEKGTEVKFNCATIGVTYYYTTDGATPSTTSNTGTSYIVNSDVTLKVIAVKEGMDNSAVATASYTVIKSDPQLAFSEENVTAYYGQDFTPPTLTYADGYDGTITYSSSNSAITVDPTTGEISFGTTAIDKTTTITATASETSNFLAGTATYTLTVKDPNAITVNLNNETFGTHYEGSITPIANFESVSGTIENITITYGKGSGSYAYINDAEIRFYNGNTLTFEVPEGYLITSMTFNAAPGATADVGGSFTDNGRTWTSEDGAGVQKVILTRTNTRNVTLKSVIVHLSQASSSVAKPIITPATGTYTEAQTVTITTQEEGATIYYTTDGSAPTTSSTVYKKSFVLSKNGTYTIKAIAVKDNEVSLTSTSTITIAIPVDAPVFTETSGTTFTEPYAIHLTATDGLSIYYATGSDSPIDEDGNLSGKAISYNDGINNLSKATTITAVAMDAAGNLSETVTATYNYAGTVNAPYYENFDQGLGNFTVETEGDNPPVWTFRENASQADIERYGEARRYAFVNGSQRSGTARLISPMIDLTDETITTATLNFIHAGRYFDGYNQDNLTVEQTAAGKAPSHAQLYVREEGGSWTQLTIPNWFTQSGQYTRFNSGDIDLSDYAGKKIQISFLYTADSESTGIWNVLKFALTTTETEVVNMKTDGYVTYVVKNDIDWEQTLARNNSDGSVNVHGYKVIEFSKETAVFAEFGVGENEKIIPAETPIIMKGTQGENHLVIAKTEDVIAKPKNNLLKPSYGDVKATDDQRLLVFQKSSDWTADDPYNNYGFFKLATGRTIPERKSYLNGTELSETITNTTNAALGIFLLEDLGNSELTSISSPKASATTWMMQGAIYDLSGRKVADSLPQAEQLSKGIYIVNGRKIVIK